MVLAGIIPGKSEPQHLDPYIEILVDEILSLSGKKCYDAYRDEYFEMKVDILMNVLDYPGQNKLFHCVGKYTMICTSNAKNFFEIKRPCRVNISIISVAIISIPTSLPRDRLILIIHDQ